MLFGVPLSTDQFMLPETQHTFIFSFSSQRFTTGPKNVHDFGIELLYKIVHSLATDVDCASVLIEVTCSSLICDLKDENDMQMIMSDQKINQEPL